MTLEQILNATTQLFFCVMILGTIALLITERIRKIWRDKNTEKVLQIEKKELRKKLEMFRDRTLQDKREVSAFVFYDGGRDYEESTNRRAFINIRDYAHNLVEYTMHKLSKEELSWLDNELNKIISEKDDLDFGHVIFPYINTFRRMQGEIILRKEGIGHC